MLSCPVDLIRRWWPASPTAWRWVVFGVALTVRLGYVSAGFEVPPQDTPDYDEIAVNLLRGEGFVARENWHGFEVRSWRPPFYPVFLAFVYGIFGYSHLVVRVIQCFVGALTALLVYETGRRLDRRAAPLAGAMVAVYGPLVGSANEVMTEVWFVFWLVLGVWLLVDRRRDFLGGASLGMAALTRPVGLFFVPGIFAVAWAARSEGSRRRALWALLAVLAMLFPWTLRNYMVHGHWPIISTHGGFILARSNAVHPAWRQERGWGIERRVFDQTPSEVDRDRMWYRQGLRFIREHPGAYIRLAMERFLRFWYFFRPAYNFWFMSILPFSLAGMYRFWNKKGYLFLTCGIVLSVVMFSTVLYGDARFRLPLEPFFILFAAGFLRELADRRGVCHAWIWAVGVVGFNLLVYWQDEAMRAGLLDLLYQWQLK